MTTKVLTAHVPQSLADKVDQMAARLERSRGWIVNRRWPLGSTKKKSAGV
jgi:predicted transcriptional regulator